MTQRGYLEIHMGSEGQGGDIEEEGGWIFLGYSESKQWQEDHKHEGRKITYFRVIGFSTCVLSAGSQRL